MYCLHQVVTWKGFFTGGEDPLSKVSAGTGLPATAESAISEISKIRRYKLKLVLRYHHLQTSKTTLCLRPSFPGVCFNQQTPGKELAGKYFSHVKDVFLQCKGTIFCEKNPCDLSKAESSPLREKHTRTLTTTEENPMPPPKDRGILARGWFPVLSRLPRILLHIVSKTFERL